MAKVMLNQHLSYIELSFLTIQIKQSIFPINIFASCFKCMTPGSGVSTKELRLLQKMALFCRNLPRRLGIFAASEQINIVKMNQRIFRTSL